MTDVYFIDLKRTLHRNEKLKSSPMTDWQLISKLNGIHTLTLQGNSPDPPHYRKYYNMLLLLLCHIVFFPLASEVQ